MTIRGLAFLAFVWSAPIGAVQIVAPYPPSALEHKEQGTVAVALAIAPSGAVSNCTVTHSVGSAELDKATCAIATRRSFPIQAEQVQRVRTQVVRWIIPGEAQAGDPLFTPTADFIIAERDVTRLPRLANIRQPLRDSLSQGADNLTALMLVAVGANGELGRCSVLRATGLATLDESACDIVTQGRIYQPAIDAAGNPVAAWIGIPWTFQADLPVDSSVNPAARDSLPGSFSAVQPVRQEFWFANDDYPLDAIKARQQGEVVVDAEVGADSRAHSCRTVLSSGFAALDEGTCRLLMRRAFFIPARDSDGKTITGIFRQRMNWTLVSGQPLSSRADNLKPTLNLARIPPGLVSAPFSVRYLVDQAGHIERCEPLRSSGIPKLDEAACKLIMDDAKPTPSIGENGKPERSVRTDEILLNLAP